MCKHLHTVVHQSGSVYYPECLDCREALDWDYDKAVHPDPAVHQAAKDILETASCLQFQIPAPRPDLIPYGGHLLEKVGSRGLHYLLDLVK